VKSDCCSEDCKNTSTFPQYDSYWVCSKCGKECNPISEKHIETIKKHLKDENSKPVERTKFVNCGTWDGMQHTAWSDITTLYMDLQKRNGY
jgi:hypothetical protein